MSSHRYLHLDVFTDRRFSGNQLAVFPDASGLDPSLFQAIAAEMAFSETTFVLPPRQPGTDAYMRIFTPARELPMAGHPTIGSTFALAGEGRIAAGARGFVFELGVGPTPVALQWRDEALAFAWMTQPIADFGPVLADVGGVAAALGVPVAEIADTAMPVEFASAGVPALFVPLASRAAVDAVVFERATMRRVFDAAGVAEAAVFVFSVEAAHDDATAYSRMFAPAFGITEDPATGGASGPLGSYLLRHHAVTAAQARSMVSLQGVRMGRPSRIHIDIESDDAAITRIQVGGQSVLVAEGTLIV